MDKYGTDNYWSMAKYLSQSKLLVDVVLHFQVIHQSRSLRRLHGPSGSAHITSIVSIVHCDWKFLLCDWVNLLKLCKPQCFGDSLRKLRDVKRF